MLHITHRSARVFIHLGILAVLGGLAFGWWLGQGQPRVGYAVGLAGFLAGFGLLKGALALDTTLSLRAGDAHAQAMIASHGSARTVRTWVIYKWVTMVVALGAAVLLCVLGLG